MVGRRLAGVKRKLLDRRDHRIKKASLPPCAAPMRF